MPQPLRSFLAVIAGCLAIMAVVVSLTLLCVGMLHLKSGQPTPLYLTLNLVYSLGAALLGGWLTARIARVAPLAHGAVLAAILFALSVSQFSHPAPGQPYAYLTFLTLATPLVILGGAALAKQKLITPHLK